MSLNHPSADRPEGAARRTDSHRDSMFGLRLEAKLAPSMARAGRFVLSATALVGLGLGAAGCGPDCQSTCNRLYSQNECDIQRAGIEREELLGQCMDRCEVALTKPGEANPDYNPAEKMPPSEDPESSIVETDEEAAMWMDCVEETSCELLDEGYCWGIGL
jgi:hypothetical protein